MSLIAHYKLDGNAKDSVGGYHLNNINGSTSFVNGKLGQALDFNASGHLRATIRPISLYKFSLSYWGRGTAIPSSNYRGIWRFLDTNNTQNYYGDTRTTASPYILHVIKDYNVSSWSTRGMISVSDYAQWKWHHYSHVAVGKTFYSYRDGVLIGTNNITQDIDPYTELVTFDLNYSGSNAFEIDDVRIYDHALSPREVRDLAQAKVLHYKFDNFAEPTTNLVPNSTFEDGDGGFASSLIQNSGGINDSRCFAFITPSAANGPVGDQFAVTPSTTYTVSAYVRTTGSIHTRLNVVFVDDVGGWTQDAWHVYSGTINTNGQWVRYENQLTTASNIVGMRIRPVVDGARTESVFIDNIQVEAKGHVTPFVDGTRDGVVTDASGQDNHATLALATTPQWVEDSKIGSGAYTFDGVDDEIIASSDNAPFNFGSGDFSISLWANPNVIGTSNTLLEFGRYTDGILFRPTGSSIQVYLSTSNGGASYGVSHTRQVGRWDHYVVTRENGSVKTYVNNVMLGSMIANGDMNYNGPAKIGSSTHTGSQRWNGKIDDVRVYATALSADEIQEIYQQRASLDSGGNFHVSQLTENIRYVSPIPSAETGWAGGTYRINNTLGESDPCSGALNFEDALAYAHAQGGRLPTLDELLNNATSGSGCGYDSLICWTCTKGIDDSMHWCAKGLNGAGTEEVRSNTQTAYVRFVADDDINRSDPVVLEEDGVISGFLHDNQ